MGWSNKVVFLYFSDWTNSANISQMEHTGLPHVGRLIKIFAHDQNPSILLNREVAYVEEDSNPFSKTYKYPGRGPWLAEELEFYLTQYHLPEDALQKSRALFRFANRTDLEIAQLAMSVKNAQTGEYHYKHPIRIIDGLDEARDRGRFGGLHLDVFTKRSQDRIGQIVDLENPQNLLTMRETVFLVRSSEGGAARERR